MKPDLKIEIGQPKDENDDLIMISDDGEAEISKSLIKTKTDIKSKNNLKCKKKKQKTIQKADNKTKPTRCS